MWNKKKEEEYPPKPAAPTPATNLNKESVSMSSNPAPSLHTPESRGPAVIGKSVMIKGQIFSREDLTIDGEIDGSVELNEHRLTIGPHGKLQAGVKAREVVVLGVVHGNVEASEKVDIRKDAKLVGDIKTARIVIEDGAYFKGSIDIVRSEGNRASAAAAPRPIAASSPTAVAAATPNAPVAGD